MIETLADVRAAWEAYRASLSREVSDREALRQAMRAAIAAGASQSEIARMLRVPRQHIHRLLGAQVLGEANRRRRETP